LVSHSYFSEKENTKKFLALQNRMGKRKITYILFAVLLILAVIAYLMRDKNKLYGDVDISLKNTDIIEEIFLSDMANRNIKLVRQGDKWILNDSLEARIDAIESIMQTIRVQQPQQPVTAKQSDYIISTLSTHGIKVILYGKKHKKLLTYFVGGQAANGIGTYMYKEGAKMPYLYNARGFTGDLGTRYFTKLDEWRSRKLLEYNLTNLNLIQVNYIDHPDSSFVIKGIGASRIAQRVDGAAMESNIGKINVFVQNFKKQMVSGWENSDFAKDSLITKNRYYGNFIVGQTTAKLTDTFHLFYCPADPKSKTVRELDGKLFDLDYLFVFHKNNLGLITTESLAPILVTPSSLR
jgi:hypothetical protein